MQRDWPKPELQPDNAQPPEAEGRNARRPGTPPNGPSAETADENSFRSLVRRANSGERDALVHLRQVLDNHSEVWDKIGDLAAHAEAAFIAGIAGKDALFAESLQRKLAELKLSLTRPGTGAVEQLAVQRVVACWLQLQHADALCAQLSKPETPEPLVEPTPNRRPVPPQPAEKPTLSLREAAFWSKRQDQAARRYEAATKLLLVVQQLQPNGARSQDVTRTGSPPHGELRQSTEVA